MEPRVDPRQVVAAASAATLLILATGARTAAVEPPAPPDWDALQTESDRGLDAPALADLEALLLDPVDLGGGEVERLRLVPWLSAGQIATLATAPPVRSEADLAGLPGWGRAESARLLPFVRFAPPRAARRRELRFTVVPTSLRATAAHGDLSGRGTLRKRGSAGYLRIAPGPWELVAGDVRLGFAQGLLVAPSEDSFSAALTGWRARSVSVGAVAESERTLRGAGISWRGSRSAVALGLGRTATRHRRGPAPAPAITGSLAWRCGQGAMQAAAARTGASTGASIGAAWEDPSRRAAGELALAGHGRPAVAAALEVERGQVLLASSLQDWPASYRAPFSALPIRAEPTSGRRARIAARLCHSLGLLEAGFVQSEERDSGGTRRFATAASVEAETGLAGGAVAIRGSRRGSRSEDVGESTVLARARRRDAVVVRFRRPFAPAWTGVLEFRRGATQDDSLAAASQWHLRFERRGRRLDTASGVTAFRAAGMADPFLGPAVGAGRVRGDGLRAVLRATLHVPRLEAGATLACTWVAAGRSRVEAGFSLQAGLH
jgi:hypothetical protein